MIEHGLGEHGAGLRRTSSKLFLNGFETVWNLIDRQKSQFAGTCAE